MRRARQTRVEWPFAKLLGRKREIGCNPCAVNRKCRTNIFVPFSFSAVRLFARPSLRVPRTVPRRRRHRRSHPLESPLSLSRAAHRKSLPRRQLSAGDTADWLRRKRRYLCCSKSRSLGDGFNTLGMNNLTPSADCANTFRRGVVPVFPTRLGFTSVGTVACERLFVSFPALFSFFEYSALTFLRIRRLGECNELFSANTFCPGV